MQIRDENPKAASIMAAFQTLFFSDYKGGSSLFIGSILNSLAQMSEKYPWAKQALDDFQWFKVLFDSSTGQGSREFLDNGFDRENFSAVFPLVENWDMKEVKVVRHFFCFKDTVVEACFGVHSESGPFISCFTHLIHEDKQPCPTYCVIDMEEIDGFQERDNDRMVAQSFLDFAHWMPYATLRYSTVITNEHTRGVEEEKERVTMVAVGSMLTNTYQSFIKKYLVEQVYNGTRGITPDNIESEWGVPKNLLDLGKFRSSRIVGSKDKHGVYTYEFQAVGCTPTGVPDIVFNFRFLFKETADGDVQITGKILELFEVDNIEKTLTSLSYKAGSLLDELVGAFLNAHMKQFCAMFLIIYKHYNVELEEEVHLEDKDHAKTVDYRRK